MTSELKFKRDKYSGWWAYGEHFGYQIRRDEASKQWQLIVREVLVTAGVRHTLGQPELFWLRTPYFETLALAKDTVQRFENDPKHDLHEARMAAYQAEHEKIMASIEALANGANAS